ncbi:Uncharacterised protein [Serratia entomophila]|jgi:hypothetical protein|nr:Uncharacterised protein [Serratia entomophila]CAI0781405.1 Uncharacterised protein [Serratia entomophila]CAI0840516.1 Uncharacterised protein [Serratia entomophila]CAI0865749.1 Uncharacterised protein [Serratia entomophila]CAI0880905.1 Uncharacterised protein [Serratia entomophila]
MTVFTTLPHKFPHNGVYGGYENLVKPERLRFGNISLVILGADSRKELYLFDD